MISLIVPEVTDSKSGRESIDEYKKAIRSGLAFVPVMLGSLDKGIEVQLMAVIPAKEVRYLEGNLFVGLKLDGVKDLRNACDEIIGESTKRKRTRRQRSSGDDGEEKEAPPEEST